MAGPTEPNELDPWAEGCIEEFENPTWEPLGRLVGQIALGRFMWMGRVRDDGRSLELYKHRTSQRYLNVDQDGNTYLYERSRYVPIPTSAALARVFGRGAE
jgi:hypothetical protein